MKTAVVTMNVKQGKCEENFAYMETKIKQAILDGADLIVFPQNAVSGYLLGDRWLEDAWCKYVDSFNDLLIALSQDIAIVWGNVKYRNHRRFNAAFFAYQGKTHMRVKKNENLPYFSDVRYFEESDINSAIEFKDMVLALNFHEEVQLADMNINLDAHPYDMDERHEIKGNVIYVNAVGTQNNAKSVMIMQGGSAVQNQKKLLYQAPYFEEDYQVVDILSENVCEKQEPVLLDALACGIKDFDMQVFGGKLPWVVGLSGGLDSSVTCALLAYALGSERVYGFNMATKHNSNTTITNAAKEASALGIHYKEGSIQAFVEASAHTLMEEYGFHAKQDETLVMENIQARARGYLLSGFAGILGGVIVNNGNKVESMLGYCTLYGDSVGALSLIGDLTKVQLFDLSRDLNAHFGKEVIPLSLLPEVYEDRMNWEMAPSAELKENQFDPMKWFYHDYLVEHLGKDMEVVDFMRKYYHHELDEELGRWIQYYHLDEPEAFLKDLDWFLSTVERNSFKRLQTPPVLCLHKKSLATQIDAQMRYDKTMYEKWKENIRNM
ncbi:MAG: NAD(+) synthase [Longicatena sp.]